MADPAYRSRSSASVATKRDTGDRLRLVCNVVVDEDRIEGQADTSYVSTAVVGAEMVERLQRVHDATTSKAAQQLLAAATSSRDKEEHDVDDDVLIRCDEHRLRRYSRLRDLLEEEFFPSPQQRGHDPRHGELLFTDRPAETVRNAVGQPLIRPAPLVMTLAYRATNGGNTTGGRKMATARPCLRFYDLRDGRTTSSDCCTQDDFCRAFPSGGVCIYGRLGQKRRSNVDSTTEAEAEATMIPRPSFFCADLDALKERRRDLLVRTWREIAGTTPPPPRDLVSWWCQQPIVVEATDVSEDEPLFPSSSLVLVHDSKKTRETTIVLRARDVVLQRLFASDSVDDGDWWFEAVHKAAETLTTS